jgi:hypothetical protein
MLYSQSLDLGMEISFKKQQRAKTASLKGNVKEHSPNYFELRTAMPNVLRRSHTAGPNNQSIDRVWIRATLGVPQTNNCPAKCRRCTAVSAAWLLLLIQVRT